MMPKPLVTAVVMTVLVVLAVYGVLELARGNGGETETAEVHCDQENAEISTGEQTVRPRVVLQPDIGSQERVINFGDDRDPEAPRFKIKSEPPLERDLEKRLDLTADTFVRTGNEKAEFVSFPEAKFTRLEPSRNRESLEFTVCLEPSGDLPAGSYTGLVTLAGPPGVEGTTVTITANAKDELLFYLGGLLTLALALGVLLYKGMADRRAASIEVATNGTSAQQDEAKDWKRARNATVKDVGWVAPTVFAIGATAGTLYGLYASDPAWGADGPGSVAALIGAGLAAVGAKAIFSPSR